MIKTMKPWIAGLCAGALAALAGPALADYPEKPVTMIVAYSPGGGTDTAARTIAKYVEKHLGQRLVVENKPGAGGQIGFSALARAATDGYEIGFINVPSIQLVKRLRDNVPYELSDFQPIANIQLDPVVVAVEGDEVHAHLATRPDSAAEAVHVTKIATGLGPVTHHCTTNSGAEICADTCQPRFPSG